MAKLIVDAVMDSALANVALSNLCVVLNVAPTVFSDLVDPTKALADVALTPLDGAGDWTIANGDVSGRKLTLGAQSAVPVDASGVANHVAVGAWISSVGALKLATTCNSLMLAGGGTVDIPAFKYEITDPT